MSDLRAQLQQALANDNLKKFLTVLSMSEGTATFSNPYLAQGGTNGKLLSTGYQAHPGAYGNGRWNFKQTDGKPMVSTANGRYAITYPTWQGIEKAIGKLDFSPQSQDLAAAHILYQRNALKDVLSGNFNAAMDKLGSTWVSLPTAPAHIKQPKRTWGEIQKFFEKAGLETSQLAERMKVMAPMTNTHSYINPYATTTPPTQNDGTMEKNKARTFLQDIFTPPKMTQDDEMNYNGPTAPAEFPLQTWLFKPTGMYGG